MHNIMVLIETSEYMNTYNESIQPEVTQATIMGNGNRKRGETAAHTKLHNDSVAHKWTVKTEHQGLYRDTSLLTASSTESAASSLERRGSAR